MIRLCDIRRPPTAAADRDLQRRVLDLALEAHPLPLAFTAIPGEFAEGPGELPEALALIRAVRDLVLAGLLERGERMPRIDTAIKLAGAVGVPCEKLVKGIEWTPGSAIRGGFSFVDRAVDPSR